MRPWDASVAPLQIVRAAFRQWHKPVYLGDLIAEPIARDKSPTQWLKPGHRWDAHCGEIRKIEYRILMLLLATA